MIRFTVDGTKHELDEETLTFGEARTLEKVTGRDFGDLPALAARGNMTVVQGFIWVALKRSEPTLAFSALDDRAIGDYEFQPDEVEDAEEDERPTVGDAPSDSVA